VFARVWRNMAKLWQHQGIILRWLIVIFKAILDSAEGPPNPLIVVSNSVSELFEFYINVVFINIARRVISLCLRLNATETIVVDESKLLLLLIIIRINGVDVRYALCTQLVGVPPVVP
jgi:hypothetical protein